MSSPSKNDGAGERQIRPGVWAGVGAAVSLAALLAHCDDARLAGREHHEELAFSARTVHQGPTSSSPALRPRSLEPVWDSQETEFDFSAVEQALADRRTWLDGADF